MIAPDAHIEISIKNEDYCAFVDKYQLEPSFLQSITLCCDLVQDEAKFNVALCSDLSVDADLWKKLTKIREFPTVVHTAASTVEEYKMLCESTFEGHESKGDVINFMLVSFEEGFTDFQRTKDLLHEHNYDY